MEKPLLAGLAGLLFLNAPALTAQTVTPAFEVATIKPVSVQAGGGGTGRGAGTGCPLVFRIGRARVDIECATLPVLVGYAFGLSPDRIAGPGWMKGPGTDRFQITATLPRGASESQVPEMVQALLKERFGLAAHRGTSAREVYALVVTKGGLKAVRAAGAAGVAEEAQDAIVPYGDVQTRQAASANGGATTLISNPRMGTVREIGGLDRPTRWEAPGTTLAGLADLLDKVMPVSTPVVDATSVRGRYSLVLEVAMNDLRAGEVPNPATDLEPAVLRVFNDGLRKLGLRLERGKGQVPSLIVDRIERMPSPN